MGADNIYWLSKSLTNSGTASPDASANFVYLGNNTDTENIQNLNNKSSSPISVSPIPKSGSSGSVGITYAGTTREIKIEGSFVRSSQNDLNAITSFIEGIMNGSQKDASGNMGYHLRLGIKDTVYRVGITDFIWDYNMANPTVIEYTLTVKEIRKVG